MTDRPYEGVMFQGRRMDRVSEILEKDVVFDLSSTNKQCDSIKIFEYFEGVFENEGRTSSDRKAGRPLISS